MINLTGILESLTDQHQQALKWFLKNRRHKYKPTR